MGYSDSYYTGNTYYGIPLHQEATRTKSKDDAKQAIGQFLEDQKVKRDQAAAQYGQAISDEELPEDESENDSQITSRDVKKEYNDLYRHRIPNETSIKYKDLLENKYLYVYDDPESDYTPNDAIPFIDRLKKDPRVSQWVIDKLLNCSVFPEAFDEVHYSNSGYAFEWSDPSFLDKLNYDVRNLFTGSTQPYINPFKDYSYIFLPNGMEPNRGNIAVHEGGHYIYGEDPDLMPQRVSYNPETGDVGIGLNIKDALYGLYEHPFMLYVPDEQKRFESEDVNSLNVEEMFTTASALKSSMGWDSPDSIFTPERLKNVLLNSNEFEERNDSSITHVHKAPDLQWAVPYVTDWDKFTDFVNSAYANGGKINTAKKRSHNKR